jgi:polysaccharide export outer membrane protein
MLILLAACAGPEKFTAVETLTEFPSAPYVYHVAPGDEIHVEVLQDDAYEHETTVLSDGSASFKWVGSIDVMGLTLAQTRDALKEKLVPYFTRPTITLQLKRINGPDPIVYLGNFGEYGSTQGSMGPRQKSGVVPYRKGLGLMETLALAGGPGEPDFDVVPYLYVVRNMKSIKDRVVYRFDLALAVRGESPDLPLFPGDVIFLDQSWLQDLGRAFSYVTAAVAPVATGLNTALLVDALSD